MDRGPCTRRMPVTGSAYVLKSMQADAMIEYKEIVLHQHIYTHRWLTTIRCHCWRRVFSSGASRLSVRGSNCSNVLPTLLFTARYRGKVRYIHIYRR